MVENVWNKLSNNFQCTNHQSLFTTHRYMSRRKRLSREPVTITIESLSHEGRGIGHIDGKTVFVDEALPGESVNCRYTRRRSRFSEAKIIDILQASPDRIEPKCEFYNVCGGCSFQHVGPDYQVTHKQSAMLDQMQRISGLKPDEIITPVTGPVWGYRRRARLGVKYVEKKQKLLVGFREKKSPFIADISHCEVLHPRVRNMLVDLQDLIGHLSVYRQLPQIEVAVADNAIALVFRHIADLSNDDRAALERFEQDHEIIIYLQPGGLDSVRPLTPGRAVPLYYRLPLHDLKFEFLPTDFIQVNVDINRQMVDLALSLLQLEMTDHVLDLFCGLGNFSLPLAKRSGRVTAIEGDSGLVERAGHNAALNRIDNAEFHVADLADSDIQGSFMHNNYQRVLLDPPRTGADVILRQLSLQSVKRLVYISCNPATLARDAGILVRDHGFRLQQAGVMDMFPHTSHVESIALFTRC